MEMENQNASQGSHVIVCTPVADRPRHQYVESLVKLLGVADVFTVRGRPIPTARAILTERALADPKMTHVLWIDDDMQFESDALLKLLAHNLPIVGGLCFNRRPPYQAIIGAFTSNGALRFIAPPTVPRVVYADATGAGFLLMRRTFLENMTYTNNGRSWEPEGDLGEDFSFCHRANQIGYHVAVDCGTEIGHITEIAVDRAFASLMQPEIFKPKVSIVIPVFNQRPELFIRAVNSALDQTEAVEVIVVDDGSDVPVVPIDGTTHIRFPQNHGIAAALNAGIDAMTTPWFCWLSSDDTFEPIKVELQLEALLNTHGVASCHGYKLTTPAGDVLGRVDAPPRDWAAQKDLMRTRCILNGSTVMIHRSVFRELGRFDAAFHYGQDWDMWERIVRRYPFIVLDRLLGTRSEGGNLTQTLAALPEDDPKRITRDREDTLIRSRQVTQRCPRCEAIL